MEIKHTASAGTLESSDALVTVEQNDKGVDLLLQSPVIHQFGEQMRDVILDTLDRLEVKDVKITIVDKGALDCTLKARVEAAVYRASDQFKDIPWGGMN